MEEEERIKEALVNCGYPKWSFEKVKQQMRDKTQGKKKTEAKKTQEKSKGLAVIPYVKGTSEALSRIFKKHNIQTAMRPHMTLRKLLVHPKDKRQLKDNSGVVYRIPCKNCEQAYVGETSRNLEYRLDEHEKDIKTKEQKKFTRAERKTSESEYNKSALTDHSMRNNHVIDWNNTKILDRDSDNKSRRIREAIWISIGYRSEYRIQ